jgi:hypothetical protein
MSKKIDDIEEAISYTMSEDLESIVRNNLVFHQSGKQAPSVPLTADEEYARNQCSAPPVRFSPEELHPAAAAFETFATTPEALSLFRSFPAEYMNEEAEIKPVAPASPLCSMTFSLFVGSATSQVRPCAH